MGWERIWNADERMDARRGKGPAYRNRVAPLGGLGGVLGTGYDELELGGRRQGRFKYWGQLSLVLWAVDW